MANIDWTPFDKYPLSENACWCGAMFHAHMKVVLVGDKLTPFTRTPCPGCGKNDNIRRSTSAPERMSIEASDVAPLRRRTVPIVPVARWTVGVLAALDEDGGGSHFVVKDKRYPIADTIPRAALPEADRIIEGRLDTDGTIIAFRALGLDSF